MGHSDNFSSGYMLLPNSSCTCQEECQTSVEEKVPNWYTDLPGVSREYGNMLYRDYVGSTSKE